MDYKVNKVEPYQLLCDRFDNDWRLLSNIISLHVMQKNKFFFQQQGFNNKINNLNLNKQQAFLTNKVVSHSMELKFTFVIISVIVKFEHQL